MFKRFFSICALACLISTFASALLAEQIMIPEDTEVKVVIKESVSSERATSGQRVEAEVKKNVVVNGQVVILAGTPVKASITRAEQKKRLGKGGELAIEFRSTKAVNGTSVPLRSTLGNSGKNNSASTITLTVLFGVPGLLRRGQEAVIKEGTEVTTYVDESVDIDTEKQVTRTNENKNNSTTDEKQVIINNNIYTNKIEEKPTDEN